MIKLEPFTERDFERLITWIDNKELLMTIAGPYFSFPLTEAQLQAYLNDAKSHSFNIVDVNENTVIGHAEIRESGDGVFKIDKLLIGDKASRGKGLCQPIMRLLANYAFTQLQATTVELNVFDWNAAAIKCYEKTGFVINADKTTSFPMDDKVWTALNMQMEKAG